MSRLSIDEIKTPLSEEYNCISKKKTLEIVDELKRREGKVSRRLAKFMQKYDFGGIFSSVISKDKKLEEKIPWSARTYSKIVLDRTGDWNKYREAIAIETEIYTWVRNIDLYSETGKEWNKRLADIAISRVIEISKQRFGEEFTKTIEKMPGELVKFFDYEKQLSEKIMAGSPPTDHEIEKYLLMRSSDSLLHAKIVEGFTGEDWSLPMQSTMQLKDTSNDMIQYPNDFAAGLPNVYYMFGSQEKRRGYLSPDKISDYALNKVEGLREDLINSVKTFDFKNCNSLENEMVSLYLGK